MRAVSDEAGTEWRATAREEVTPRHHGRWYLVFESGREPAAALPVPEVRWQTQATAERTIRTMSEFELRRRLLAAQARFGSAPAAR